MINYQRAIKACNLCHEYSSIINRNMKGFVDNVKDEYVDKAIKYMPLRDNATFEAMRALELSDNLIVKECLNACVKCDCSKPSIAKIIQDPKNEKFLV
ncbi:MAG: hypothetical protein PHF86_13660 [Candidatus Nanoarchaeia archaeon]|nr:hypothetical protein [Candidatus Nanoarchaeia archaeon]